MSECVDERRETRTPVSMPGRCRHGAARWAYVHLDNLSSKGCCFSNFGLPIREDGEIVVSLAGLAGLQGLTGKVRWISYPNMGVEFDRSLYAPILEHLCRNHPPDETD